MKIKTNAGEVELTAEMVCRGMVFTAADYHLGGGLFVVGRRDDANNVWRDAGDDGLGTNLLGAQRFLGCDPTIASRADCERYGVHGDAAAHGFARLRDGGAVDLRRVAIRGAVAMDTEHAAKFTAHDCTLRKQDRFFGLDARHASPEDVRRLCCGEYGSDQIDNGNRTTWAPQCTLAIGDHDTHEDLASGVKWSAGAERLSDAEPRRCPECLAGEGQQCAEGCPRVIRYKASRCGTRPERGQVLDRGNYDLGFHIATGEEACARDKGCDGCHVAAVDFQNLAWSGPPVFLLCPICTAKVMPYAAGLASGFSVFDPRAGKNRESAVCEVCFKAHADNVAALRWEGDRLVVPDSPQRVACPNCGGDDATCRGSLAGLKACAAKGAQWGVADIVSGKALDGLALLYDEKRRAGETCEDLRARLRGLRSRKDTGNGESLARVGEAARWAAASSIPVLAKMPAPKGGWRTAEQIDREVAERGRRNREAPLVALVAAVPEGLDPIGWRAAVLAVHEHHGRFADRLRGDLFAEWLVTVLREGLTAVEIDGYHGLGYLEGLDSYQRAIAPAPKVDRVRATWKTRGPVLPVDDGRDE